MFIAVAIHAKSQQIIWEIRSMSLNYVTEKVGFAVLCLSTPADDGVALKNAYLELTAARLYLDTMPPEANKMNPDPDQGVGWGDRTVDEMGHAWLNITYYNDEEFKVETATRATKTVNSTAGDRQQQ